MTIRISAFATLALATSACSPLLLEARSPVDVSEYQGDGTISRLPHPINPGFKIDFPPFLLSAPQSSAFQLAGLPRPRHHSQYELALVVDLSPDEALRWPAVPSWLKANSMGSILLRVTTVSGRVVLSFETSLTGQDWSRRIDESMVFAILRVENHPYDLTARFTSDVESEQIPSVLEVIYTPGGDSQPRQARVRLEAGGED